ncbi:TetR/AcrR family transcriptional regulator [Nocardioides sp. Iso805N]|uniref:TetR/AcrR family transcriptional regulator n=1 Tax=Nocardioides sp. Iso805N TaxID=1283287 RepID=UPI00037792F7|nr:TetR/AcrR family transcriptional regulator [Nocardioides sp. Iso805N]
MTTETDSKRRKHAAGEATRITLLEAAERLFAFRGIDGVSLREIQQAAGQSNASVVGYHFGSKAGLVQALIAYRHPGVEAERGAALAALEAEVSERDPARATARELVSVIVDPLVSSIRRGEMYAPFLARLSEDPKARSEYWPAGIDDDLTTEVAERLIDAVLDKHPERVRRARSRQFLVSALHVLGDHARNGSPLSDVRVATYVDGWAALLTARVSPQTQALLDP